MYAALWRVLPGPVWLRVLALLALAFVVVAVLFTWVFPWVDSMVDPQQNTLGIGPGLGD